MRGSGHKGAAAKVELQVKRQSPIKRDAIGRVKVTVTKNTVSAPIESEQIFKMGGDGAGQFEFERLPTAAEAPTETGAAIAAALAGDANVGERVLDIVARNPGASQNDIVGKVDGAGKQTVKDAIAELISNEKIEIVTGDRGTHHHYARIS